MKAKTKSGSDVVLTKHHRIYRIQWCRNGFCYVVSNVNHALIGVFNDLRSAGTYEWVDDAALPEDVREAAMGWKTEANNITAQEG